MCLSAESFRPRSCQATHEGWAPLRMPSHTCRVTHVKCSHAQQKCAFSGALPTMALISADSKQGGGSTPLCKVGSHVKDICILPHLYLLPYYIFCMVNIFYGLTTFDWLPFFPEWTPFIAGLQLSCVQLCIGRSRDSPSLPGCGIKAEYFFYSAVIFVYWVTGSDNYSGNCGSQFWQFLLPIANFISHHLTKYYTHIFKLTCNTHPFKTCFTARIFIAPAWCITEHAIRNPCIF